MNMKRTALAALMGALCGVGQVWAADPNSDAFTIRITPSVDYGVDVDTATTQLAGDGGPLGLGSAHALSLNSTYYFVSPATVTVLGNFSNQEVSVSAAGLDTWLVDADEAIELNRVQLYALFTTNKSSRPLETEFGSDAARHQVTGSAQFAGETSGSETNVRATNRYEIANGDMTGGADMDGLSVSNLRQLWLRLDTPSETSVDTEQKVQVTVTAASGVTN